MTTTTEQTTGYLCKRCGAESPGGIGYAGQPDAERPASDCPGPHLATIRTAPAVTLPGWVPDALALTPEGVARHATVIDADTPHNHRVAGTAVYSGATGEWCITQGTSGTIGGPSRAGREAVADHARRASLWLSDWTDVGRGVSVATVAERDWSCAP